MSTDLYPAESFKPGEIRRPLPTEREIRNARRHQTRRAFKAWMLRRARLSQSPYTRVGYPVVLDLPRRERTERFSGAEVHFSTAAHHGGRAPA